MPPKQGGQDQDKKPSQRRRRGGKKHPKPDRAASPPPAAPAPAPKEKAPPRARGGRPNPPKKTDPALEEDSDVLLAFGALLKTGDAAAQAAHARYEAHEDQARFIEDARRLLAMSAGERAATRAPPPGMAPPPPPGMPGSPRRAAAPAAPHPGSTSPRRPPGLPPGLAPPPPSVDHLPPGLAALALEVHSEAAPPPGLRPTATDDKDVAAALSALIGGPAPEPVKPKFKWVPPRVHKRRGGRVAFSAPDNTKGPLRPRARLDVSWELKVDAEEAVGTQRDVSVGLFRVGAPTNDAAIVAKQGRGAVEEVGLARGTVAFFAPRAAGAFVFRLLDPEPPGRQQISKMERPKASSNVYATSDKLDVIVRTHDDLLDSLKASLQQLEEPGRSRLGALQQLAVVAETLPASLAPKRQIHIGGRAGSTAEKRCRDKLRACLARCLDELAKHVPGPLTLATRRRADELPFHEDETETDVLTREQAWSVLSEEDEQSARDAFEVERVTKIKKQRNEDRRARDVHAACRRLCAAFNGNSASRQWLESAAPEQARRLDDVSTRWDALLEEFWPGGAEGVAALRRHYDRADSFFRPTHQPSAQQHGFAWRALDDACARVLPQLFPGDAFFKRREEVRRRVEACLNNADVLGNGQRLVLRVFGSSANLFGAEGADLDMCVVPAEKTDKDLTSPEVCRRMGEALEQAGAKNVQVRDTARVPIVLFEDPATGLDCDVSTHNPLALRNTELLRAYAKVDGRVRGMAYVIKKWAKIRGINSPSDGTLSSYGHILCVLAFLQTVPQPPILPSLQRLDLDWPNPKDPNREPPARMPHPFDPSRDVCLAFHDPDKLGSLKDLREIAGRNRQSLGELLALFFRHYAWDVDYRNLVVAPRTACVLPKANKAELDCWPQNPHLAIEDPFETHYNVAHVLKYDKHQKIRKEFMRASKLVDDAAAQRIDPDLALDYICEPLPQEE